ncbi:MAG: uracil-DNA glycosylase family protein [Candidatus Zixiibacteriota bacterium]
MIAKEYLISINRYDCPSCDLKSKNNIKIALVPPPNEIVGVIISHDPPVRWLPFYGYFTKEFQADTRRKMLFASAILRSLMDRVLQFMGDRINDNDKQCLFNTIFQKVYWTHLHKCFTDAQNEFKRSNAYKCADHWLTQELNTIADRLKFIIALGRDVQTWVNKWQEEYGRSKAIEIINLPHPSGLSRNWNNKDDKGILKGIQDLLRLCKED